MEKKSAVVTGVYKRVKKFLLMSWTKWIITVETSDHKKYFAIHNAEELLNIAPKHDPYNLCIFNNVFIHVIRGDGCKVIGRIMSN